MNREAIAITRIAQLEAKELAIGYSQNRVPILQGVNLSLFSGELVALVGPNGSGKTTLMRCLTGLIPPQSGKVLLEGKPLHQYSASERSRKLAIVLTGLPAIGEIRVIDLLKLGRFPHAGLLGKDSAGPSMILKVARELGLGALLNRPLYQLSDGERQRALIARALVQDTSTVLLDEPTHYLDVIQRAHIFSLLASHAKQSGRALLVATHEVEWALQVADRIAVITQTGLVSGSREEIRHGGIIEAVYQSESIYFDPHSARFLPLEP